ncbi:MAG: hypothetical protein ABI591_18455 [Kofleriaceae bacterium]
MTSHARFIPLVLVACGGGTHDTTVAAHPPSAISDAAVHHLNDPDLNHAPPEKLLSIDWASVKLASDGDALALWQQIAPTGDDWQQRLDEVPSTLDKPLALALLRGGNFACPTDPPRACNHQLVLAATKLDATFGDPCLRRELAMWAIDQLDREDLPAVKDALKTIVALPPPESQLVADALQLAEPGDQDLRLELLGIAWRAGQRELVNGQFSGFDEAHLLTAATQLHIDGAFDGLSAETERAVFLKAIGDDQLLPATRAHVMTELLGDQDVLGPDLKTALIAAVTKAHDCETAAAAAHELVAHDVPAYAPTRPRSGSTDAIVRGLCVLAAYEGGVRADQTSPFASYLPARGLELVRVSYDPYSDVDTDGDGDPHTEHINELIPRANATLPEAEELARALPHCTKQLVCSSDDHDVKLTLENGLLTRLEIVERPPCQAP